eukprot:COSAG03_NODE_25355_length_266_cov_0.622754_1_plen_47_part_01
MSVRCVLDAGAVSRGSGQAAVFDRPVDALATSNERVLAAKVKFANRT